MKTYQCHKIVQAMEIGSIQGSFVVSVDGSKAVKVPEDFFERNKECDASGYLVKYKGGYLSWSPKDVFEAGYTEVENGR